MIYGNGLRIDATVKQSHFDAVDCIVTSISDTIIKFDCGSLFDPETDVDLEMQGLNIVSAKLLWKKGDEYGCRVDYAFHPAVIGALVDQSRSEEIIEQPFTGLIKTVSNQRSAW